MLRIYFRQAVEMLRQNLFISAVSILGTALAIMMIMTMVVVDTAGKVDLAPEVDRSSTYYIVRHDVYYANGSSRTGMIEMPADFVEDYLYKLNTPELVAVASGAGRIFEGQQLLGREGGNTRTGVDVKRYDHDFWKLFSFSFVEGAAPAEEEYGAGMKVAVISQSLARSVFEGEQAVGRTIEIDDEPYRVSGVVRDVSKLFRRAYADVWIPYGPGENRGPVMFKVDKGDLPALRAELADAVRRYNAPNPEWDIVLHPLRDNSNVDVEIWSAKEEAFMQRLRQIARNRVLIVALILLIPAINLSALTFSKMRKRTAEVGIRKAFGARRRTVLAQVLVENMVTSLSGGVLGLLLSYGIVLWLRDWLFGLEDLSIPVGVLVSWRVFAAVAAVCVAVNLVSAAVPAWRASRISIVDSINQNDR